MSASIFYICNCCGRYSEYGGDSPHNIVKIDLTYYLILSSGLMLKNPIIDLNFCKACYAKLREGDIKTREYGGIETLRKTNEELKGSLVNLQREFNLYKSSVAELLNHLK